jgi:hypothetical protein
MRCRDTWWNCYFRRNYRSGCVRESLLDARDSLGETIMGTLGICAIPNEMK